MNTSTTTREDDTIQDICVGEDINKTNSKPTKRKRCIKFFEKWFAVVPGFVCTLLGDGFIYHLSSLFLDLQNEFETSKAETAIVQSVASGTAMIGGIFAGLIVTKFGIYRAGFLAAFVECLGLAMSFFAPNIPFLIFSLGILTAFGTSLSYSFGNTVVAFSFQGSEQVIAFCIVSVGLGIGSMSFSYIINSLSLEYGWRGAMLILSGIMSHLFIIIILSQRIQTQHGVHNSEQEVGNHLCKKLTYVLKQKLFVLYIIITSVETAILSIMLIFHVDYLETKGYTRSTAVFFYFTQCLTATIAVLLPGILKKLFRFHILKMQAGSILIGALGYGLLPLSNSYKAAMTCNCLVGAFFGLGNAFCSAGVAVFLGPDHFPIGLGFSFTLAGALTVVFGPLAGLVKDLSGSYDWLYYGVGICLLICAISMVVIAYKRKTSDPTEDTVININKD